MLKRYLSLIFIISFCFLNTAQADEESKPKLFRDLHGDYFHLLLPDYSDIKVGYGYQPEIEEDGGPGEFNLNRFFGGFNLPLPVTQNTFFTLGVYYELLNYDFKKLTGAPLSPGSEVFHKAEMTGGFGHFFSDDFLFMGSATLGAYSNLENSIDADDFQLHGKGYFVYRINPGAQILAGAAYDEIFDDTPLYPLFGVRMLSNDGKLHLVLTLPTELRVGFRPTPETEYYVGGWISGNEYRFNSDFGDFKMQTRENRLGVGLVQWMGGYLSLTLEAGAMLDNTLKFKQAPSSEFAGDLKPGAYLTAIVGFAF